MIALSRVHGTAWARLHRRIASPVVGFIADAIDAWADQVPACTTARTTGYSVRSISYITIRRVEDRAATVLPRQGSPSSCPSCS
jgi:hypothetical protein